MNKRAVSIQCLNSFQEFLLREEKSTATVEKYLRDVRAFLVYAEAREVTKELVIDYKHHLLDHGYAIRSVNSMLAGLNCFLAFKGLADCKVKNIRMQRQTYCAKEEELTKEEYMRLLAAAKEKKQLNLVIQTICGTGIRVSELKYFTVESVDREEVCVQCKSKTRAILIPGKLRKRLLEYAKKNKITKGSIFITKGGKPLDRSYIWAQMKKLCVAAQVNSSKVFPHNLRKLFARTYYKIEKDIAKLADILGHSNIETTRIYIMTTGKEHRNQMERLQLVI